ncbi:hypothetical protein BJX61DRAFT_535785 [Aspergillus egyptiacus]|nr:hypothetical protein BJX61DRAFT_535785 [Aspergillus egyptiacus]
MEADFYSSLNWGLTGDPREALFPWESVYQCKPDEAHGRPTDPQLDSLLSASSYPVPEAPQFPSQAEPENSQLSTPGGLLTSHDHATSESIGSRAEAATPSAPNLPRGPRTTSAVSKRGRPRKLLPDGGVNSEERRRMQVRMAQRAYRSRKEASAKSLKDRISQLETAVTQMSTAVIAFGDELIRSGALDSCPDLLMPLGNTVQTCLALPGLSHGDATYQVEPPDTTPDGQSAHELSLYQSPSRSFGTGGNMEISEFLERLHVTCGYQAYLVCANPAVPLRRLERPFRMLLSLMPRPQITEFFKDWLLARAGHKTLNTWEHIPFFQIGGAGTHYPASSNYHRPFRPTSSSSTTKGDLTRLASDIQQQFDDEWFDLGDLGGYLREQRTVFPSALPTPMGVVSEEETDRNCVSRLIQALVRRAICLGRSPGFRRRDVEAALEEFKVYSAVSSQ